MTVGVFEFAGMPYASLGGSLLTQPHCQVMAEALSCWARMRSSLRPTWRAPTRWTALFSRSDWLWSS